MVSALFKGESKSDLKLLLELAKKIGIKAKFLTSEEMEDLSLGNAMDKAETKEYVNAKQYLASLKK